MAPKTSNHEHATNIWDLYENSQHSSVSLTRPQHEEEERKKQVFVFEFPSEWQEASKYSVDKVIRRETDMSSVSRSDSDDSSYTTSTTTDMMIAAGILVDPEDPLLVSEVEEEGLLYPNYSKKHPPRSSTPVTLATSTEERYQQRFREMAKDVLASSGGVASRCYASRSA
jgi:hypothetical protein